ncbi:type III polyketide synthase [Citricoccus sp. SGAir0253]|uniref:type III polyketide synthase n=1 Tax=Citricoccus sp. SGAir0253 TaxID=2567881 RepID=UPI0010CD5F58|nr:type III polyketide synthase [Citricoccus sp. SGAir0253]
MALIRSLHTAVPPVVLHQDVVRDVMAAQPGLSRLGQRLVPAAFNASGIERRHTVVEDWRVDESGTRGRLGTFFEPETGHILNPSTGTRNLIYTEHAAGLFVEAGRGALEACPGVGPEDVTHVITVSCTGFFSPGPDYQLVRQLGLPATTKRVHIGFMGCYAALPALREAASICEADPAAVVLVVSAELCTLHVRVGNDQDTIVGASLFSDGAAAAVVTAAMPAPGAEDGRGGTPTALCLDGFATVLTPVGEEAMAWNIGDHGFEMILGTYVPHIIDEHITTALEPLLAAEPGLAARPHAEIEHWAIHPGGRSILDKVESRLGLSEEQLQPAREVLRDFGNMSSATVMFVLQQIMQGPGQAGERVCAMAFGPGLTVESALMTRA